MCVCVFVCVLMMGRKQQVILLCGTITPADTRTHTQTHKTADKTHTYLKLYTSIRLLLSSRFYIFTFIQRDRDEGLISSFLVTCGTDQIQREANDLKQTITLFSGDIETEQLGRMTFLKSRARFYGSKLCGQLVYTKCE